MHYNKYLQLRDEVWIHEPYTLRPWFNEYQKVKIKFAKVEFNKLLKVEIPKFLITGFLFLLLYYFSYLTIFSLAMYTSKKKDYFE